MRDCKKIFSTSVLTDRSTEKPGSNLQAGEKKVFNFTSIVNKLT